MKPITIAVILLLLSTMLATETNLLAANHTLEIYNSDILKMLELISVGMMAGSTVIIVTNFFYNYARKNNKPVKKIVYTVAIVTAVLFFLSFSSSIEKVGFICSYVLIFIPLFLEIKKELDRIG